MNVFQCMSFLFRSVIVVCICGATYSIHAQQSFVFEDFYGASGRDDFGFCIKTTSDGGAVSIGASETHSKLQGPVIHVIRVDPLGATLWEQTYEYEAVNREMSIAVCENGDLVFAAGVLPAGSSTSDILVVRTNANGVVLWARLIGQNNNLDDLAAEIIETQNNDIVVAGTTLNVPGNGDEWLVARFSANGGWQWGNHYGQSGDDYCYSLCELSSGSVAAAGAIAIGAGQDCWLLEVQANGVAGWSHSYGPTDAFLDGFRCVMQSPANGDIYASGTYQRTSGFGSSIVVAVDHLNGSVVNALHYRTTQAGNTNETARWIVYNPDNDEYVVAGRYVTANDVVQPYMAALPEDLSNLRWMRHLVMINAGVYRSLDLTDGNARFNQNGGYWVCGGISENTNWQTTQQRYHSITRTNWNGKTKCTEELDWDSDPTLDDAPVEPAWQSIPAASNASVVRDKVNLVEASCAGEWIGANAKAGVGAGIDKAETIAFAVQPSTVQRGGNVRLTLETQEAGSARVVVTDIRGQVLYRTLETCEEGINILDIHTYAWPASMYFVQVSMNDTVLVTRLALID